MLLALQSTSLCFFICWITVFVDSFCRSGFSLGLLSSFVMLLIKDSFQRRGCCTVLIKPMISLNMSNHIIIKYLICTAWKPVLDEKEIQSGSELLHNIMSSFGNLLDWKKSSAHTAHKLTNVLSHVYSAIGDHLWSEIIQTKPIH